MECIMTSDIREEAYDSKNVDEDKRLTYIYDNEENRNNQDLRDLMLDLIQTCL